MPVPAKFDDIAKPASSVLGDDYQVKGNKIELKNKTNLQGAVSTPPSILQTMVSGLQES